MNRPYQTLGDMIAEDEAAALAKTHAEMAAEKQAWNALTDEQRAAALDAQAAKWDALCEVHSEESDVCECGDPDCDFDCDGGYDESEA